MVDVGQGRISVLAPDGATVHATRPAEVGALNAFQALPDGRFITNALRMTAESAGLPLHLYDATGEHLASFGTELPGLTTDASRAYRRNVSLGEDGTLWVVPFHAYQIERWSAVSADEDYFVLDTIYRPAGTVEDVRDYQPFPERREEGPPTSQVQGVWKEPEGHVWVMLHVPRPDWEERWDPDPVSLDPEFFASHAYHRTRLEAFDPATGELVATTNVDEMWLGFVGGGEAYSFGVDDDGRPFLDLWRFRQSGPSQGE